MRISEWSSDVCSSDLVAAAFEDMDLGNGHGVSPEEEAARAGRPNGSDEARGDAAKPLIAPGDVVARLHRYRRRDATRHDEGAGLYVLDRNSVVEGRSVSVRVDLGGRR